MFCQAGVDISGELYTPAAPGLYSALPDIIHIFSVLEVPMFGSNENRRLLCSVHPLAGHACMGLSNIA